MVLSGPQWCLDWGSSVVGNSSAMLRAPGSFMTRSQFPSVALINYPGAQQLAGEVAPFNSQFQITVHQHNEVTEWEVEAPGRTYAPHSCSRMDRQECHHAGVHVVPSLHLQNSEFHDFAYNELDLSTSNKGIKKILTDVTTGQTILGIRH